MAFPRYCVIYSEPLIAIIRNILRMSIVFCVIFYEFYSNEEISMIYERIKHLCKEKGISVNYLEKKIDVARGSLCKIDKHKPSAEKMKALADELDSNVDYLVTGQETKFSSEMAAIDLELTDMPLEMKKYALKLAELPEEKQKQIMSLIDMLEG